MKQSEAPTVRPNPYALTEQKEIFCHEYLIDLNGKRAAMRAGCTDRSSQVTASRWLNEVAVSQRIDELMGDRSARTLVTADMLLRELAMLSLSDMTFYTINEEGYVELAEGAPDMAMRCIKKIRRRVRFDPEGNKTIETEFELWDKIGAIRMAGKHIGMFTERHEITGPDGGPIKTEHVWKLGDREVRF